MADPNALPRRIVKETQRLLSEPGELRGTARGVCVRACAALASPRVCRTRLSTGSVCHSAGHQCHTV